MLVESGPTPLCDATAKSPPILMTGSSRLRPLSIEDAPALFPGFSDESLMRFWATPPHRSIADTEADIRSWLDGDGEAAWAIEHDGAVVGRIGLYRIREGVSDVGVFLLREAQGRGLALAALHAIVEDGFTRLGLHRIGADIDPENAASIRLFERAGFACEGRLRGYWKTHTGIQDSLIYARTRF
jgi:RimJ/RimL family protein N-acetyltransferase